MYNKAKSMLTAIYCTLTATVFSANKVKVYELPNPDLRDPYARPGHGGNRYRHPGLTFEQVFKKYPHATKIAERTFRPQPGEKRLTWLVVNDGNHIQLPRAYC